MMLVKSLRISLRALTRNKLRTGLAALGMTIGVAAVLAMFALGTGAQRNVTDEVRHAGTTLIDVKAGNYTRGGEESNIATGLGSATTLVASDAEEIAKIPGVRAAAPQVTLLGWARTPSEKYYTQIVGTGASFAGMYDWSFPHGKFFRSRDVNSGAHVAVIGPNVQGHLFGDANPVGENIEIHGETYRVVGVITTNDQDQEDMVFIPYTALQKSLGIDYLHSITVSAEEAGEATRISADIENLLRQRHHLSDAPTGHSANPTLAGNQLPGAGGGGGGGTPDDFTVKTQAAEALTKGLYTSVAAFVLANMSSLDQVNMEQMIGTLNRAGRTMTALLAAIATISLVVGGIGIMNIMLVSVKERTREIGIRRAVGARTRDVLQQFLVEAVVLSLFGGIAGIVLGFFVALVVESVLQWPASISIEAIALSFGIAAAVGVFFGFYPAHRASQLSPIDALRYE